MCDLGGQKIGTDQIYQGQDATITAEVVRYDESVMTALLARIQGGTTGQIGSGQIGGLMIGQSLTQRLLIGCPYQSETAFSDMTPAYNFLNTYLDKGVRMSLGTKVKKCRMTWRAVPNWNVSGGMSNATLWNNSLSGAATIA